MSFHIFYFLESRGYEKESVGLSDNLLLYASFVRKLGSFNVFGLP